MIRNKSVQNWVKEMSDLLSPEEIVWVDGSEAQIELLRKVACGTQGLIKLNQEFMPGCYLHRSAKDDVARVEDRTFICCQNRNNAGFTNNWLSPKILDKLYEIARNTYAGRIMYAIPFSMAHIGSDFCKLGIEITDSIYVALSMIIMTRVNRKVYKQFDKLENEKDWTKCLHCSCNGDKSKRYICHFPESNMIVSVNSSYGGNALLGKKCLALRLGSYMGRSQNWLAEHMLILGIKIPKVKEIKYICAAFPSGCGKTNLAMMKPGDKFRENGYEIFCVGDDISWLRIKDDGRLWAVNPENGFFGVTVGTNEKTNPNALQTIKKDTIFTNVVFNEKEETVWWEGLNNNPPEYATDWQGEEWDISLGVNGAHPNSRFTSPAKNCPSLSDQFDNPDGVPISAILFGGRRSKLTPLVFESKNWDHGVFIGSTMSSETTSAASGEVGLLRHDPFAMLPFCGYNISDYLQHWLNIGKKLGTKAPKIFNVNWFRTNDKGDFIWPGFGENLRVLEWIIKRCENEVDAYETGIGFLPNICDLNLDGLNIPESELTQIFEINPDLWKNEIEEIKNFYSKFDKKIPEELYSILDKMEKDFS